MHKERVPQRNAKLGSKRNLLAEATGNQLLMCKKTSLISTFNCRTLSSVKKLGELTASAQEYNIDIVCIQEHRILHEDTVIRHHVLKNKWVLLTSSADKALNNATIRGVGMLLSPKAYKALNSVETISSRIMIATFNGNPAVTIISCYSPTNVSNAEDKDQFYSELTTDKVHSKTQLNYDWWGHEC